MGKISQSRLSIDTVGGAGVAVGSGTTPVLRGHLIDIFFDFNAAAPNTTDVVVSYATRGGIILTVTSTATDILIAPRKILVDPANAALTAYDRFPLDQALTVAVDQCDALTAALDVTIRYEAED